MKITRGDVIICVAPGEYGKPRPAIVVQSDLYNHAHASITLCPMTSELYDAPLIRITIESSPTSGLSQKSQVMIDKIASLPRGKIRQIVGKLSVEEMNGVQQALKSWLAL